MIRFDAATKRYYDYDVSPLPNTAHLDQGESAFFLRDLEQIDQKVYMKRYPALKSRLIIPTFESVGQWAHVYTWREWTPVGSAKVIGNAADDLPMADVTGAENSQIIKEVGAAYAYSLKEIRNSSQTNTPLDAMRAIASRTSTEQLVDGILAKGDANNKLNGILSLDATSIASANRVTLLTPATKAKGGLTWGTLVAPNATGQEVANDLIGLAADIVSKTKGIWESVRITLPIDQYNYAASVRLNAINDTTALEYAMKSQFIESITPWYQCTGAGGSGADRMMGFVGDPAVLGGIVPYDWTPQAPQQRNLAFVVNATAAVGGVVCRYPIACRYMDGI